MEIVAAALSCVVAVAFLVAGAIVVDVLFLRGSSQSDDEDAETEKIDVPTMEEIGDQRVFEPDEAVWQEEEQIMFGKKNGKVFEDLIGLAQKTLKEAEQRQKVLAELPEIGKIPEYREMLEKTTKGLRNALRAPVGSESQHQVVQWLAMASEAMLKTEALRYGYAIRTDKAAHEAVMFGIDVEYMLLGALVAQEKLEFYQSKLPYDLEDFKPAIENYIKQGTELQMQKQWAKQLGIELRKGFRGPLEGMEALAPVKWDPNMALSDGGEDWSYDDVPDADSRTQDEGDQDKDVVDAAFSEKEMGEELVRKFSPNEDGDSADEEEEYPEILWDKEKE